MGHIRYQVNASVRLRPPTTTAGAHISFPDGAQDPDGVATDDTASVVQSPPPMLSDTIGVTVLETVDGAKDAAERLPKKVGVVCYRVCGGGRLTLGCVGGQWRSSFNRRERFIRQKVLCSGRQSAFEP